MVNRTAAQQPSVEDPRVIQSLDDEAAPSSPECNRFQPYLGFPPSPGDGPKEKAAAKAAAAKVEENHAGRGLGEFWRFGEEFLIRGLCPVSVPFA
jgi:hypothetical protein